MTTFWQELETKKLTRQEIESYLVKKLGEPTHQLSSNLLQEITKKIISYYSEDQPKNFTIYTLTGSLTSSEQILERKFRDGKRRGQSYYVLKVGSEQLQATEAEIEPNKWEKIKRLAIIGQNLVFKYRKFYQNKQLLDYYDPNLSKLGTTSFPMEKQGKGRRLKATTERQGKVVLG